MRRPSFVDATGSGSRKLTFSTSQLGAAGNRSHSQLGQLVGQWEEGVEQPPELVEEAPVAPSEAEERIEYQELLASTLHANIAVSIASWAMPQLCDGVG